MRTHCSCYYKYYVGHHPFSCVISSSGYEWVFFNAAQVLPCYVIQVCKDETKALQHTVPPPLASLAGVERSDSDESAEKRKMRLKSRVRYRELIAIW